MSVGDPCYRRKQKGREWASRVIILNRLVGGGAKEKVQLSKDLNEVIVRAMQIIWEKSDPGRERRASAKALGPVGLEWSHRGREQRR